MLMLVLEMHDVERRNVATECGSCSSRRELSRYSTPCSGSRSKSRDPTVSAANASYHCGMYAGNMRIMKKVENRKELLTSSATLLRAKCPQPLRQRYRHRLESRDTLCHALHTSEQLSTSRGSKYNSTVG